MKNIKWAAIQPLTGGMYLGAEEAFGYPAEWILTYNGLDEIKRNSILNEIIISLGIQSDNINLYDRQEMK